MHSPGLLFLSNLFSSDMIIIIFVALLLFGGEKLPEIARGLGKGIRDFKDASEGVKREINNQINNYEEKREEKKAEETVVTTPAAIQSLPEAVSETAVPVIKPAENAFAVTSDPFAPAVQQTETTQTIHTEPVQAEAAHAEPVHTEQVREQKIAAPFGEPFSTANIRI